MNKSDSGDLAEAIRRAESRAAVIQSLKLSYGSTKPKVAAVAVAKSSITTECAKLPVKEKSTVHIKQSNNNPIDSKLPYPVLPLGGANTLPGKSSSSSSKTESSGYGNLKSTTRAADLIVQSMRAWRPKGFDLTRDQVWLTDSIHNKSVILDSKAAATACSITRRSVMNNKRASMSVQFSNKKQKLLLPSSLSSAPHESSVALLHASWTSYVASLAASAQTATQLQAIMYGSDRMGALVHVMHSERCPDLVGLRGVVVAESKGCLFLANDRKAHREPRRRREVRTVCVSEGAGAGAGEKADTVSAEEEDVNVCTARESGGGSGGGVAGDKVGGVCTSSEKKESGDGGGTGGGTGGETKKIMKVARVVKEDSILAVVVTMPESSSGSNDWNGNGYGNGVETETPLQLLHRACRADITASHPCGDDDGNNKKGPIVYLLHGDKCLPFCNKGAIS